MDYTYLKNNAFQYTHLNNPGTFINTGSSVKALEFDGAGTYYLYKEGDNVNLLSFANKQETIPITQPGQIFSEECINLYYIINVNVHNPDIILNSAAEVIVTVNESQTSQIVYNTPDTIMVFTGKVPDKQYCTIEITTINCTLSGNLRCISDILINS